MRTNKTYKGYYVNKKKNYAHENFNGRNGKNMSLWKSYEYSDLIHYIMHGHLFQCGYIRVIHRLRKNLKYRKTFIRKFKEKYS